MGSRIRDDAEHIFEVFTEVARPMQDGQDSFILQTYPENFQDKDMLKNVPKFTFPCQTDGSTVDHFTFVLTDIDGKFKFGFCRHAAGGQTALVIISSFPWFEIFYKLLNQLAEITNRNESNSVAPLLNPLYKLPIPQPKEEVEVVTPDFKEKIHFRVPDPNALASLPETFPKSGESKCISRNLTEYYNAVEANAMIIMFASMLNERRIIITSRKLSRLTACVHASAALLYPMHWQNIFIPVLPMHLIDYCSAPMPYIIGIHSSLMSKVTQQDLGDAVILDADKGQIKTEHSDLEDMPSDVVSLLRKRLKSQQTDKMGMGLLGDGVSRAFLKAMVALIGGYREALKFPPGEQIKFDPDMFICSRPTSMQPFLAKMLALQMFEQFINERVDQLIAGKGFVDEFETEVNTERDKWLTQTRYKEWLISVKKQGKKIRRDGKDKWVDITNKVRDKSKKAFKEIGSKFNELRKEDEDGNISRSRPTTIKGQQLHPKRPPRPKPPDMSELGPTPPPRQSLARRGSFEKLRQYKVITVDDLNLNSGASDAAPGRFSRLVSADDNNFEMSFSRISVGLMGDPDIQNIFKKSYSLEDLTHIDPSAEVHSGYLSTSSSSLDQADEAYHALDNEDDDTNKTTPQDAGDHSAGTHQLTSSASSSTTAVGISRKTVETPDSTKSLDQSVDVSQKSQTLPVGTVPDQMLRKKPTPLPRSSLYRKPSEALPPADSELIRFDAPSLTGPSMQQKKDKRSGVFEVKDWMTFDPLDESPRSSIQNSGIPSTLDSSSTSSQSSSGSLTMPPATASDILDPPAVIKRSSVARHHAFNASDRPSSVRRKSHISIAGDAQTMKDARTAFMKAEGSMPASIVSQRDDLDLFDPLLEGRVAVDDVDSASQDQSSSGEDRKGDDLLLLKEWNLDRISKLRLSPTPASNSSIPQRKSSCTSPPVPPKPNPSAISFDNSRMPGVPSYFPAFNQQPFQPGNHFVPMATSTPGMGYRPRGMGVMPPMPVIRPHKPNVHQLIDQFSSVSPSSTHSLWTPSSQVLPRRSNTLLSGGSTSNHHGNNHIQPLMPGRPHSMVIEPNLLPLMPPNASHTSIPISSLAPGPAKQPNMLPNGANVPPFSTQTLHTNDQKSEWETFD